MRLRAPLAILTAAVLLMGIGCLVEAWRSSGSDRHLVTAPVVRAPFADVPLPAETSTTQPAAINTSLPVPSGAARPIMVQVPAVGLAAPVVPVGLDAAGQIDLPGWSVAGWYRLGPAPGAVGPAVLVGHVDSRHGPAVFYRLSDVRAGDEVVVVEADGSRARFVISHVTVIKKAAFPLEAVFSPTAGAELRLVTCTGQFDTRSRHYVDSLIAWGVAEA